MHVVACCGGHPAAFKLSGGKALGPCANSAMDFLKSYGMRGCMNLVAAGMTQVRAA